MTKRLTPSQRAVRKRDREFWETAELLKAVEAGQCDHLFEDAEAKADFVFQTNAVLEHLLKAVIEDNPDLFKLNPDGTISTVYHH